METIRFLVRLLGESKSGKEQSPKRFAPRSFSDLPVHQPHYMTPHPVGVGSARCCSKEDNYAL